MEEFSPNSRLSSKKGQGRIATEDATGEKPPAANGRRALLVETEAATLRICRDVLESSGFAVETADSGIAAVVATRRSVPDLILLDLQLRDVPGREAIEWLRSNPALRATPIILLTANAQDDAELAFAQPSAALRKPLAPTITRRTIHDVLTQYLSNP